MRVCGVCVRACVCARVSPFHTDGVEPIQTPDDAQHELRVKARRVRDCGRDVRVYVCVSQCV